MNLKVVEWENVSKVKLTDYAKQVHPEWLPLWDGELLVVKVVTGTAHKAAVSILVGEVEDTFSSYWLEPVSYAQASL